MRKIAIRIDDVCPRMDIKKFRQFEKLLDKYGIKPLIGVVPDCTDVKLNVNATLDNYDIFLQELSAKGWTIAMHGYNHHYTTAKGGLFPLNKYSEFAGISYKEQYHMLVDGKKKLKELGIDTGIFMAPAHSYDRETLKALKKAGFEYVTDGFGPMPYNYNGLTFLPISMIKSLDRKCRHGYTTFVVHTASMTKADFDYYEKLFKENRSQFIDYRGLLRVKPVFRGPAGAILERVLAIFKALMIKLKAN